MRNLKSRIGRLEGLRGPVDDSPIVATLRCLGGRTFTRKGLSDYGRNTPPGFAHPIRGLIAHVYMRAGERPHPGYDEHGDELPQLDDDGNVMDPDHPDFVSGKPYKPHPDPQVE